MPKKSGKGRNRQGASNKKGRKFQILSKQGQPNVERLCHEDNNNLVEANPEESEESSGCEASEGAQEWREWYKQQQKVQKMKEECFSDQCEKSKENECSSIESSQLISESTEHASSESSQSSMTDKSINDPTDEVAISKEENGVSDAEIIARNNYASNFCRHEIGEYCACSQRKDFRNLDGEPVAYGKTYHDYRIWLASVRDGIDLRSHDRLSLNFSTKKICQK